MKLKIIILLFLLSLFIPTNILAQAAPDVTRGATASVIVPPKATDFQLEYESLTLADPVTQWSLVEYQITYGSDLFYDGPITLEASWDQGIIQDSNQTQTDIVEYVSNTATYAYGSTQPIIDTVNRKITWTISSFPAKTFDETVNFKLRTTANYQGTNTVNFTTHAVLKSPYLNLTPLDITKSYQFDPLFMTPTPIPVPQTATPGPISTPTASFLASPTPSSTTTTQVTSQPLEIRSLTNDSATAYIQTSTPTRLIVQYGEDPNNLDQEFEIPEYTTQHELKLPKLKPGTTYYLKVIAITKSNVRLVSDIYTLKTPLTSDIPEIKKDSIIITSDNNILLDASLLDESPDSDAIVVLPPEQVYEIKISLDTKSEITSARIYVRNKNVLGASTDKEGTTPTSDYTELIEQQPGRFVGKLKTPNAPGIYEVYLRTINTAGAIIEQKIGDLKIAESIHVKNSINSQPIEGAILKLYYYNWRKNSYDTFPVKKRLVTDKNGELRLSLPRGKYKIRVQATGYKSKIIEFSLGAGKEESYPQILIEPEEFSLLTTSKYYLDSVTDLYDQSQEYLLAIANSNRFFQLNALIIIAILVFLTLLSLSFRIHIPLHSLLEYVRHSKKLATTHKNQSEQVRGQITDESTNDPVSGTDIYLIDANNHKIVSHTKTNSQGEFAITKIQTHSYEIEVMKDGYSPIRYQESEIKKLDTNRVKITISKNPYRHNVLVATMQIFKNALAVLFEILLLISVVFEIALGNTLGWEKVAPFLALSVLNFLLWLIHISRIRS